MSEVIDDMGLKPAQLARMAGINRSLITRYIKGEDHPRPETFDKITAALHVPAFVFYMDRIQAEPFISDAKKSLKIVA